MTETADVAAHYASATLLQRIEAGLAALGAAPPVPLDLLAPVDEFHVGGRQATIALLGKLGIGRGQRVLDLGCGLGGAARLAAEATGARLVGIDLTGDFIATGRALTEMTGLADRVELVGGSVLDLPFGAGGFDAAYMIHVGMNVADKHRLAAEAARVLKPGGLLGIYDIVRTGPGDIAYPLPWAAGPRESALAPLARYRDALAGAGLEIVAETDRRDFAAAPAPPRGARPVLGLHLVMGAGAGTKIRNLAAAIAAGAVAPVEIVARKPR